MTKQNIDLNNLDKSNWKLFKFEDIAEKISETVKPDEADVDIYVGLEHLDANDIHLRRKGVPSDVKGGKLRCYPGDVIFGKRRAYQRKAAIVDFDGICSAHAFVFRANSDIINPKLFPFFLHSDQFMHRMVDISVGGLSPTINWGDLKHQEFLLPPKEQQAKLAKLLWAMDAMIERELKMLNDLEIYKKANYKKIYNSNVNRIKLGNSNLFKIISSGIDDFEITKEYISTKCVENYKIIQIEELIKYNDRPSRANMQPVPNSVWFAKMKDTLKVIKPNQKEIEKYIFSTGFCGLKINTEKVNIDYVFHYLLSDQFNAIKDSRAIGTTQLAVNNQIISTITIPLPDLNSQNKISSNLNNILCNIEQLELKLISSKALKKSLINQVF